MRKRRNKELSLSHSAKVWEQWTAVLVMNLEPCSLQRGHRRRDWQWCTTDVGTEVWVATPVFSAPRCYGEEHRLLPTASRFLFCTRVGSEHFHTCVDSSSRSHNRLHSLPILLCIFSHDTLLPKDTFNLQDHSGPKFKSRSQTSQTSTFGLCKQSTWPHRHIHKLAGTSWSFRGKK